MGAAGFEEARITAQNRPEPLGSPGAAAQDRPDALAPASPTAALVAALARAAAAAAEAGDLVRTRALLDDAGRAIPASPVRAPVRLVDPAPG